MKNILVTGGAGYVGSGLLRTLLNNSYKVTCIDKLDFGGNSIIDIWNHKNFQFYKSDINDWEKLDTILKNKYYAVIHLAAIVGDPACSLYPEIAEKTNLVSSKKLLDLSIKNGVEKFIFSSTCSNYGKMKDSNSFVYEDSKLAPISLYAELKVEFENYLLKKIGKINDFHPTALRFSTVYGLSPRMRFDLTVNEFTKDLTLGKELIVFGEQFWRPYCHVDDFANAFLTVLKSPNEKISYNVFNVGDTNENYTKKMLVEEIIKILPNSKIRYIKKNEDPRDYRVNSDKIKNELGFKINKKITDGITEIKNILEKGVISDPENQRYYNIPHKF